VSTDCPAGIEWCAGGHRCSPLLGEHRSDPWPMRAPYGTLVATRIHRRGEGWVELRALVRLPADEQRAEDMARALAVGVDVTIHHVTRGALRRVWRQFERLTGVKVR
jgi:hypothetical protein